MVQAGVTVSVLQSLCCSGRLACLIIVLLRSFCHLFSFQLDLGWLIDSESSPVGTAIVLVGYFVRSLTDCSRVVLRFVVSGRLYVFTV